MVAGRVLDRVAVQGGAGLILVGLSWSASWLHVEPIGRYSFFPLWLGYILVVDAIVLKRNGASLLTRSVARFVGMFVASMPLWWAFELVNTFTENWRYLGVEHYSTVEYALLASWNFSIVVPAVFETAELVATFGFVDRFRVPLAVPASHWTPLVSGLLGVVSMSALFLWPRYAYPLTWVGMFLVLDPINHVRRNASIIAWLQRGDWRLAVSLALGALVCGLFWEMWNQWAYPKWVYSVPPFDFAHVFEMPLLGYAGYLPFGLEVYAGYHFIAGLVEGSRSRGRPSPHDAAVSLFGHVNDLDKLDAA